MRRKLYGLTIVALTAGLTLTASAGDEQAGTTLTIGDPAPDIDIAHWIKGVEVDSKTGFTPLTSFEEGRVYVLEFWATWCGPCRASMPHLSKLQEKYQDYATIIGVSDEPLATVVPFLFEKDKYDDTVNNDRTRYTLCTDPDESVKQDYFRAAGQRGIPTAFIIGKDQKVEWIGHPMYMDEPLDAVIFDTWDRAAFKTTFERKAAFRAALETANKEQDWPTTLDLLSEAIEADPDNVNLKIQMFSLLLTRFDRPSQTYALGHEIGKQSWDNANTLNGIAWMIAGSDTVKSPNLDFALKMANRANELTDSNDPAILDTVARVHYEKGDLEKAVKWQRRAADAAGDNTLGEDIRTTLEAYEKEAGK